MMKWDSRMHNTRSVQVLKVAIPFFDVSEGELIDVEGLLQAIHPCLLYTSDAADEL